jgi:alkanesulfonate monooxygenase SsuD/methylene tetrahydromethanopterin reductase-like flavin-dependent oxidoreductase (luciferase family)
MVKPFRFGVQCGGDRDRAALEQLSRKIEDLGYSTFYVPDHFIDTQMAPIVAMAVAAEATKTLHVGALAFDNDSKHPAILAKEPRRRPARTAAELHRRRLDEGRLQRFGLPYDSAECADRLEEALAVKGRVGPGCVQLAGSHYHH